MKITSIKADLYCFEGTIDWLSPINLRIEFADRSAIRLRGASDGESVVVDHENLDGPVDMGEWGDIQVHDLTDRLAPIVAGRDISAVRMIVDRHGSKVGVALLNGDEPVLCVCNYGDELHYGSFAQFAEYDWDGPIEISEAGARLK